MKDGLIAEWIRRSGGFTLVELVIVIVVLGIVAGVVIPRIGPLTEQSKVNATREEMLRIKTAIKGDPSLIAGSEYVNRGFEGDVGYAPSQLRDLARKPDSIPAYDRFTRLGWNGPYIDSSGQDYLYDAWGLAYVYSPTARTITSTGADPDIVVNF